VHHQHGGHWALYRFWWQGQPTEELSAARAWNAHFAHPIRSDAPVIRTLWVRQARRTKAAPDCAMGKPAQSPHPTGRNSSLEDHGSGDACTSGDGRAISMLKA
jgi:hypothetical protein